MLKKMLQNLFIQYIIVIISIIVRSCLTKHKTCLKAIIYIFRLFSVFLIDNSQIFYKSKEKPDYLLVVLHLSI